METGFNNKLAFVSLPSKIIPLHCVQVVLEKWMNLHFDFLKFCLLSPSFSLSFLPVICFWGDTKLCMWSWFRFFSNIGRFRWESFLECALGNGHGSGIQRRMSKHSALTEFLGVSVSLITQAALEILVAYLLHFHTICREQVKLCLPGELENCRFPSQKRAGFWCTKALLVQALNHLPILAVGSFQAQSCTPPLPKTKPATPCQLLHSSALLLFWFGGAAVIPAPGSHGSAAHTQWPPPGSSSL